MEETGQDWLVWITAVATIAGCLFTFRSWRDSYSRSVADDINNDPTYRYDLARNSLGEHYQHRLERGLALLDRTFGPPSSAAALGTCIIIALIYAYAGFFLVCGAGGPGAIISIPILSGLVKQPTRLVVGALVIALPFSFLCLGRWLGPRTRRFERRVVTPLQRARRQPGRRLSRHRAEPVYRFVLAVTFMVLVIALAVVLPELAAGPLAAALLLGTLPFRGVVVGIRFWSMLKFDCTRAVSSTTSNASVLALAAAITGYAIDFGADVFIIVPFGDG